MKEFFRIYSLTFNRPQRSFNLLLSKNNYFVLGSIYLLIPITGYTVMYLLLAQTNAAPSSFEPWLNISKQNYYSVNQFLLTPSMILCWILASLVIGFISGLLNVKGNILKTLSVVSLSISVAMWGGLIHDLPMSIFSFMGIIDPSEHEIAMNSPTIFRTILWTCYSIYFLAFLILFCICVRVVYNLSWPKSIFTGTIAFAVFQLVFLIYNR